MDDVGALSSSRKDRLWGDPGEHLERGFRQRRGGVGDRCGMFRASNRGLGRKCWEKGLSRAVAAQNEPPKDLKQALL